MKEQQDVQYVYRESVTTDCVTTVLASKMASGECLFSLVPRNEDGTQDDPVALPQGETTIGRGPLLKVTDRRVSRSHALLVNKEGRLKLIPKHTNPCYYTRAGQDRTTILHKDQSCELFSGDRFSLLPDCLVFEVSVKESRNVKEDIAKEPSVMSEDIDSGVVAAVTVPTNVTTQKKEVTDVVTLTPQASTKDHDDGNDFSAPVCERVENKEEASDLKVEEDGVKVLNVEKDVIGRNHGSECDHSNQQPSGNSTGDVSAVKVVAKSRKLPSWLMDSVESNCVDNRRSSATSKAGGKTTKPKTKTDTTKSSKPVVKRRPPSKRRIDSDDGDGDSDESDDETGTSSKKPRKKSDPKPSHTVPSVEDPPTTTDVSHEPMDDTERSDGNKSDVTTSKRLPPCPYGKRCYRKNPVHFQEYSHDSGSSEEDDGDDSDGGKPECPYGAACYRKNPSHRKQYRHSARPSRGSKRVSTRKTKTSTKGPSILDGDSNDDSQPNTYDYNDSFIDDQSVESNHGNDDSSSNESNWLPSNNDSDEDVTDLTKEAEDFIRNKKMHKT